VQPDVHGGQAEEDGRRGGAGRGQAELDQRVGGERAAHAIGDATAPRRAEREPGHERGQHGGDRVHRDREGEREEPHPHHLVDEPAGARGEEEQEERHALSLAHAPRARTFRCDPGVALLGGSPMRDGREALSTLGVALAALLLCYRVWAFPHWQIVSYSSLSATFLAGAVVLALGAHAVGAGACVGAAILCKQDYGLGVGAALGLAILLAPERTGKIRRAL